MSRIIAIDPGNTGAIALYDGIGIHMFPLPKEESEIVKLIRGINPDHCIIEDVGVHMKGNSAHASVQLGSHVGYLNGLLDGMSIPKTKVRPVQWMDRIPGNRPKGMTPHQVNLRKKFIQNFCNTRYPDLNVSLYAADAAGILITCTEGL